MAQLRRHGFAGEAREIAANVAAACRLDTPRRLQVIEARTPWLFRMLFREQIADFFAVAGTDRFHKYLSGERRYMMTCAVRAPGPAAA